MKKQLVLILLLLCNFLAAIAQTFNNETDEILDGQILQTESPLFYNQAIIQQQGTENSVVSLQQQQGQALNFIQMQQSGTANSGYISQTGWDLSSRMLQQGQNNEANLWSEGGHINMEIRQTGNENTIFSYIKNPSEFEKQAFLMQEGNNNRIELALFGNGVPTADQTVKITQQGNGFEATALMESFNAPIEITQKAGPGGGEMSVNVSVSDFSFPMR